MYHDATHKVIFSIYQIIFMCKLNCEINTTIKFTRYNA